MNLSVIAERFMRYVQIDTQSDPNSTSIPSTSKQKDLSNIIKEYKQIKRNFGKI